MPTYTIPPPAVFQPAPVQSSIGTYSLPDTAGRLPEFVITQPRRLNPVVVDDDTPTAVVGEDEPQD